MPIKWGDKEDRDLIFAILLAVKGDAKTIAIPWDTVVTQMCSWGHDTSKGATSQRWSKHIFKDFKESKGGNIAGDATTPAKGTSAAKRKTVSATASAADEDDGEDADASPSKKVKRTPAKKNASAVVQDRGEELSEAEI